MTTTPIRSQHHISTDACVNRFFRAPWVNQRNTAICGERSTAASFFVCLSVIRGWYCVRTTEPGIVDVWRDRQYDSEGAVSSERRCSAYHRSETTRTHHDSAKPVAPASSPSTRGAYTADTANAVPRFWLVRHTMHFVVSLFRPCNNNFPINLIMGTVSRRNEIMFTVSLFWHYLQNNIVQRQFLK